MADIKGHCTPSFSHLKSLLAANICSGSELGASICVSVAGRNVVDIYAGWTDEDQTEEWQETTIVNVWSCSKNVSNLAVLVAADRGLLDVNAPVAEYWPEFAANGKKNVLVRHVLSHSSGVSGFENPMTMDDLCDVDIATERLAAQAPWWEPGSASGYHATTQGFLDGELIRRVTGKRLKQFIADEIAGPLGADFQLGAAEKNWSRIATLVPPPPLDAKMMEAIQAIPIAAKSMFNPVIDAHFARTPRWRNSELGAGNGHANARSLNRIMSIITLGGEVVGVRLLSQKTVDLVFEEQTNGQDLAGGGLLRFGMGYALPLAEANPVIPDGKVCYWGGWGGSTVVMDCDEGMTFTYVMNKMASGPTGLKRTRAYLSAAYEGLKKM